MQPMFSRYFVHSSSTASNLRAKADTFNKTE